ncbi:hypothetical protein [Cupriavidus sp. TMH.W2]|uniref:hypothetical protein n=1 Tax=Cupriavidus sp. TMH.W2 TaxID=3434465 RepID=UPI003D76BAA5
MDTNEKLVPIAAKLVREALESFVSNGGRLHDAGRPLTPERVAAPDGGLPAVLFFAEEFLGSYEIDFATFDFEPDPEALLGVTMPKMYSEWHAKSTPLFFLSDFMRNELIPIAQGDLDLSVLFGNFRAWLGERMVSPAAATGVVPKHQPQ